MNSRNDKIMFIYNSALQKNAHLFRNQSAKHHKKMELYTPLKNSCERKDIFGASQSYYFSKQLKGRSTNLMNQRNSEDIQSLIDRKQCLSQNGNRSLKNKSQNENMIIIPCLVNSSRQMNKKPQLKRNKSQVRQKPYTAGEKRRTKVVSSSKVKAQNQSKLYSNNQPVKTFYLNNKKNSISQSAQQKLISPVQIQLSNTIKKPQYKNSFVSLIEQTSKRLGNPQNTKLFILQNNNSIVKKGFANLNGWSQNLNPRSLYCHIRWSGKQSTNIFKEPFIGQFTNHFKNVLKLTSPIERHLFFQNHPVLYQYYPRSYKIMTQQQQFIAHYNTISIFSLKNHIDYFQLQIPQQSLSHKRYSESYSILSHLLETESFYSQININEFKISIPIAIQMCLFLQNAKSQLQGSQQVLFPLEKTTLKNLVQFEKISEPYHTLAKHQKSDEYFVQFSDDYNKFISKNSFFTPSKQLIELIKLYYDYFKRQIIWDTSNIWIVKFPDKRSIITKKLNVIISNQYESIVQKYIPHNKILNDLKPFYNKPFTLNYFVLLVNSNQFKTYLYQDYYIKTSNQYHNPKFRPFEQVTSQNIISSTRFEHIMKSKQKVNFKVAIQTSIQHIIKHYFSCHDFQSQKNRFEILQISFILTNKYDPYIINIKRVDQWNSYENEWLENVGIQMIQNTVKLIFKDQQFKRKSKWSHIPFVSYQNPNQILIKSK